MKKFSLVTLIVLLIFFTAIVKNSTKRIDDQIFTKKESLRSLSNELENIKLEHDYLSSTEKLIDLQNLYFDDELIKKDIKQINILNLKLNKLKIEKLEFTQEK